MSEEIKDAKFRIELDVDQAKKDLDELEQAVFDLDAARAGGAPDPKTGKPRTSADAGKTTSPPESRGRPSPRGQSPGRSAPGQTDEEPLLNRHGLRIGNNRFGLRDIPGLLSAEGLGGALPVIGGPTRAVIQGVQKFGPMATGINEAIAQNLPPGLREVFEGVSAFQSETVKKLIEVDQRLRAIEPTFEASLQVARAQLLLGGAVDVGDLAEFYKQTYEITYAQRAKDIDVRTKTLEELSKSGAKQLIDAVQKSVKGELSK